MSLHRRSSSSLMPIPAASSNSWLSVASATKDVKVLDERGPQVDVYNT